MPMTKPYRDDAEWRDAFIQVKEAFKDQPEIAAMTQLMAVLAWRGPDHKVAWHKRTPQGTIDYAALHGIEPGTPLPDAMNILLNGIPKGVSTTNLKKLTKEYARAELI